MRYRIVASLILVCTFITTHAAVQKRKYNRRANNKPSIMDTLKFGIKIGPSLANIYEERLDSPPILVDHQVKVSRNMRDTFHAGLFGTYKLTNKLDLELLLLYARKGKEITQTTQPMFGYSLSTLGTKEKQNLDYLEATTVINIFPGSDRQFFISLGGYTGYLIAAKTQVDTYKDRTKGESLTINLKEEETGSKPKSLDLGLALGWGYEFEIGLIFNLRNEIGLGNIMKDREGKNLVTHLSLGCNLGKFLK